MISFFFGLILYKKNSRKYVHLFIFGMIIIKRQHKLLHILYNLTICRTPHTHYFPEGFDKL